MNDLALHAQNLFGIRLTASQQAALDLYEKELLSWNRRMSLTAIREPEKIRVKHFLDSFSCLCAMRENPMDRVVDVGTGAGFPGLPLKILYPPMQLTLVESVGKKAEFCWHIVRLLALDGVDIIQDRVENLGQIPQYREKFDWAIARAVASMPILMEYLLPLTRVGGAALAMKGEHGPAEVHKAEHATRLLGGHVRKLIPVTLPGVVEQRYLVVVDKVAATPQAYPRRVGLPAKHPLS
ncbi:MAG: 16S rRNA (guanine(527)-N(7))-methyltransferase RsmG [Anaerolineales bacterium]|jgi:16S rRNA (guanine527-N7)-methyltransferase